jgi:hypothetical protein
MNDELSASASLVNCHTRVTPTRGCYDLRGGQRASHVCMHRPQVSRMKSRSDDTYVRVQSTTIPYGKNQEVT